MRVDKRKRARIRELQSTAALSPTEQAELERLVDWRARRHATGRRAENKNPKYAKKGCWTKGEGGTRYTNRGTTKPEFDALCASQEYKCAICHRQQIPGDRRSMLCIDHDEPTGRFRGAICYLCNLAIGHFSHDVALLERVVLYLETFAP